MISKLKNHLPNLLTTLRAIAVPFFLWLVFVVKDAQAALILFAAASLTDWLDGFLARRWQVISNFGKIMDPLADKLLVLSALAGITWSSPYRLNVLIFIIIFARELIITILREVYKKRGIIVAASYLGKVKTFMQMVGLVFAYAFWAWMSEIPSYILTMVNIWFWLVLAITIISAFNYFKPINPQGIKP
ncbi:MAG: CDP-diacylglycerol--glycerol-3-phosphate 3-phosphatidyltransferase [Candidatus Cloacimonadaceae bacterium]|jgi:CDP-diacylglycerol--glycerol-3-phosphate 3-phosphatidyltransferase